MSATSVKQLVWSRPSAMAILDTDNGIRDVAGTNQGSEIRHRVGGENSGSG